MCVCVCVCVCTHACAHVSERVYVTTQSILSLPAPPASLLNSPRGSPTTLYTGLSSILLSSEPGKDCCLFHAFVKSVPTAQTAPSLLLLSPVWLSLTWPPRPNCVISSYFLCLPSIIGLITWP